MAHLLARCRLQKHFLGMAACSVATMEPKAASPPKRRKLDAQDHLLVKRLSEHAVLPTRGSALAAGYDLARCF